MRKHWHLIQESRTGSTKELLITVEDDSNVIARSWGLTGKKFQSTTKEVQGKNIGKANETSPHQQAVAEAEAIVKRKTREGYRPFGDEAAKEEAMVFSFYPLPENFTPSKPINDAPDGITADSEDFGDWFWERKNDGANLLLVVDEQGNMHDYSRGIKEITEIIADFTPVQELKKIALPAGTIMSYELVYFNAAGSEVRKDLRGIVNDRTSRAKSKDRYDLLLKQGGRFEIKIFDVLFYDGKDVTAMDYVQRRAILEKVYFSEHPQYRSLFGTKLNPEIVKHALDRGWEGFILRKLTGPDSHIEFTMNGKPYRKGAYKFKFNFTQDYFVYEACTGDSGRLKGKLAQFHLGKYDAEGNVVDICWAGPGNIKTDDLDAFAELLDVNPDEMTPRDVFPTNKVTVEVKYASVQEGSNALADPVIREIRTDKPAAECLFDDVARVA